MERYRYFPSREGSGRCSNSFLIDGLLIDPASLSEESLSEVRAIVLTHWHWDHTRSVRDLARSLRVPVWAPEIPEDVYLPFPPDRVLRDGDRIGNWQILATPGHSPDHICLFDDSDRLLIAGDAASLEGVVVPERGGNSQGLRLSLGKIAALCPREILPGHGPPFSGERLDEVFVIEEPKAPPPNLRRAIAPPTLYSR